ncbi:hypothetical protein C0992_011007 [Termitomyces sp. T32_za158]|nr:hypothetical protein C0992_011007 [Termitomyces sp. T32_za158]
MEGTSGLLDELRSHWHWGFIWSIEHLFSFYKVKDNFFVSTITYALSRLPDMSPMSFKEDDIGESNVHGQLLAALKKFSFKTAQVDESTTHLKDQKQQIMDLLLKAYGNALRKKHRNLSRYLLELSASLFQPDSGWSEFLLKCAYWGDAQDLHDLEDQGIDLNWHNSKGWTALHWAAYHANMDVVIALVEQKPALISAEANWKGVSQLTPLDIAAISFQSTPDVVKYLLEHGAKTISYNALYSIWSESIYYSQLKSVQLLLNCGWDSAVKDNNNETLLEVAHSRGDRELVEFLEQTVRLPPSGNIPPTVD